MSIEYIKKTYGVPANIGRRVEYTGNGVCEYGNIVGTTNAHIRVRLDGHKKISSYHPTWKIRYL